MDKIEKIPIPEDVKRVLDNVSHILVGLNYSETARDYKQAVEKLISLSEDPAQKFNTDKLREIAKPATPRKKPTPEDRAKFMKELHEYAESKKPDKSLEEEIETVWGEYECYNEDYDKVAELNWSEFNKVIKHFYDLGQSQIPMPEDTVLFNKGVAEGRRLEREDMLGDAVSCEVDWYDGPILNYPIDQLCEVLSKMDIDVGDKVRIIVIKDESK